MKILKFFVLTFFFISVSSQTVNIDDIIVPLPLNASFIIQMGDLQSEYSIFGLIPALQDINNDPTLSYFHNLSINVLNSGGNRANTIKYVVESAAQPDVLGIFGMDLTCLVEASIASSNNKLMMTHICPETRSASDNLDTFIQMTPSMEEYSKAIVRYLQVMGWSNIVYLKESENDQFDPIFQSDLQTANINLVQQSTFVAPSVSLLDPISNLATLILDTYLETRIYFLVAQPYTVARFATVMSQMGLLQTGQYFILALYLPDTIGVFPSAGTSEVLFRNYSIAEQLYARNADAFYSDILHGTDSEMVQAYRNFLGFIAYVPPTDSAQFTSFKQRVLQAAAAPPCPPLCNPSITSVLPTLTNGNFYWDYTIQLYDMLMLYARVATEMISNGENILNGQNMYEQLINRPFQSINGATLQIYASGTASQVVSLIYGYIRPGDIGSAVWPVGEFGTVNNTWGPVYWNTFPGYNYISGQKPAGVPKCGFQGEKCPSANQTLAIYIGIGMAALVIVLIILGFLLFRKWQYERAIQSMTWKIDRSELILKKIRELGSGSLHSIRSSRGSLGSNADVRKSHFSLKDWEAAMVREAKREEQQKTKNAFKKKKGKAAFSDPEEENWLNLPDFSMAMYKGQLVAMKKVYKTSVEFTRDVRKELKTYRELNHDNINPFVGAVHEPPHVFIVSEICLRGSLKDILENDEFKLDGLFLNSMVLDIIKGLHYIHDSEIKAHGRLKSSNCLVDARWVVRLSSYGLPEFREGEEPEVAEGSQEGKDLLWTAPELLRLTSVEKPTWEMLQKGDIYAFGIILHEMFGRQGPYGDELLDPKEIVDLVKFNKGAIPTRPDLKLVKDAPPCAIGTMQACWSEDPLRRPTIAEVRRDLKPLQKGLKSNILDNMIALMEKYTNNLEDVVSERTQQLDEERKKSERLLLMMLPKTIAETLKRGQAVEAEVYESVSIYFSDIVGFTSMSSDSTPMQVVTFLNDLYTCFDTIINSYDVYKVETIGDAYMVVSGLPERNGLNHAGEIASMSLNLLDAIKVFKIRHRPDETLKLRIGVHSGSCVSGVVGLRMPRYCLFGDTVNTASRMESNGEALKIHCSSQCKAILDELGGYELVERGLVAMKGKGEQLTFWVTGQDLEKRKQRIMRESEKYPSLGKHLGM